MTSDKVVVKSFGREIFKKKIRTVHDLDDAFDDIRRKMF